MTSPMNPLTKPLRRSPEVAIAYHRRELERLTGKMVSLRSREKFREAQRVIKREQRKRDREARAIVAALHDPFCTCEECWQRAKVAQEEGAACAQS